MYFFIVAQSVSLDLYQVYKASPLIYSLLGILSFLSFVIWFYSFWWFRQATMIPQDFMHHVKGLLMNKNFDMALVSCQKAKHFSGNILTAGLLARAHGHSILLEAMKGEGKRCGVTLWQRIALLNDIATIAPMLGLLGTVLGLFYAFYDVNRSADTLASIFDGLGIAVGTTVAGLIVAISSLIFYATLKLRFVRLLNVLENETLALGNLIDVVHTR